MAGRINKNWEMFDKDQWNISDVTDKLYIFCLHHRVSETGEFYMVANRCIKKLKA
jgi:hypothetical protein